MGQDNKGFIINDTIDEVDEEDNDSPIEDLDKSMEQTASQASVSFEGLNQLSF